jgi:hypothetical protein
MAGLHYSIMMFQEAFMKKQLIIITAIMLTLFSSVSFASLQNFWAYGSSNGYNKNNYISNIGKKSDIKNISIHYSVSSDWTINSAKLWIKAMDDYKGGGCKGNQCSDRPSRGTDGSEKAQITNIEGRKGNFTSKEINGSKWYELIDVTSWLMNDKNNKFTASLKSSRGSDFWFYNAKLEIDYDIKTAGIDPAPAAVPVPAAIWLFGSALFGFAGLKRKSASSNNG